MVEKTEELQGLAEKAIGFLDEINNELEKDGRFDSTVSAIRKEIRALKEKEQ